MITRAPHLLPSDKEADLKKLVHLTWVNLAFRLSIVLVLFLVLGSSQAMRAAWLEDMLTLLPPIAFLVSMRYRNRVPTPAFPYGYQRTTIVAFLCSAVILTLLGLYLVVDSTLKLVAPFLARSSLVIHRPRAHSAGHGPTRESLPGGLYGVRPTGTGSG